MAPLVRRGSNAACASAAETRVKPVRSAESTPASSSSARCACVLRREISTPNSIFCTRPVDSLVWRLQVLSTGLVQDLSLVVYPGSGDDGVALGFRRGPVRGAVGGIQRTRRAFEQVGAKAHPLRRRTGNYCRVGTDPLRRIDRHPVGHRQDRCDLRADRPELSRGANRPPPRRLRDEAGRHSHRPLRSPTAVGALDGPRR